jgi:hypothetical protein
MAHQKLNRGLRHLSAFHRLGERVPIAAQGLAASRKPAPREHKADLARQYQPQAKPGLDSAAPCSGAHLRLARDVTTKNRAASEMPASFAAAPWGKPRRTKAAQYSIAPAKTRARRGPPRPDQKFYPRTSEPRSILKIRPPPGFINPGHGYPGSRQRKPSGAAIAIVFGGEDRGRTQAEGPACGPLWRGRLARVAQCPLTVSDSCI